ncbi:MAG: mitochondrial fission ELM1 family protein [Alphaproteobacteria bacterium]|nr:mitochondrial fission ELM1 family protein [Alphaproteobacteria bacterium]
MQKTIWSLMDNRRGSVSQAKGVLDALDSSLFAKTEKQIEYTRLAALPNWLRGRTLLGLTPTSKAQIRPPFPDYVLSISRRTAPIARYIKKHSPQTKIIQLMHPGRTGLSDFDLIIVPKHDQNKKHSANIRYIIGCPHRITPQYLDIARTKWQQTFADLPKPLTAVIVGGAIKGRIFPQKDVYELCTQIKHLKAQIGGSILITTSRRTGTEAENILKKELETIPQYSYYWGDSRENPYAGFLACADNIVITADSVSMCCEATGSGKPIYLYVGSDNWLTPKHRRFAQSLTSGKYAVLLENALDSDFQLQKSLNAAKQVADLITAL